MKNNTIIKSGFLALMWLVYTIPAIAGPVDPPGEDDPIDPVPLNMWEFVLICAAITIGIFFLVKSFRRNNCLE